MTWICLGIPPKTPSCGTEGITEASAERHVKATNHGTIGTTRADFAERLRRLAGGR